METWILFRMAAKAEDRHQHLASGIMVLCSEILLDVTIAMSYRNIIITSVATGKNALAAINS